MCRRMAGFSAVLLASVATLGGCMTPEQKAAHYMEMMDARAPEDRIPDWDIIREMMLREVPAVGSPAPDFTLATLDGSETVRLSQFAGDRPVVLIFGSWT